MAAVCAFTTKNYGNPQVRFDQQADPLACSH